MTQIPNNHVVVGAHLVSKRIGLELIRLARIVKVLLQREMFECEIDLHSREEISMSDAERSTAPLRERLDKLLTLAENGSDGVLRSKIATILDTIPSTLPEIQKDILTIGKPKIRSMMNRGKPYRRDKALKELRKYNYREDMFGQICDLILRIAISSYPAEENQTQS